MQLRSRFFALGLLAVGLAASSAFAATVNYILDLSVDNAFTLKADVLGADSAGLVFYDVPLLGDVLTLDHRAPVAVASGTFAPAGFNVLRSSDSAGAASNPEIIGSQDAVTGPQANLIYGFGQEASSFAAKGITPVGFPDATSDAAWLDPLVLAIGTYNRSAGTLTFNTASANLVANVFATAGSRDSPAATVTTQIIPFGGPGENLPPVVDNEPPELDPNTTGEAPGSNITTTFTATDATFGPVTFSNAVLSSFVPFDPGFPTPNPAFNGTVNSAGVFTWNTTGFRRGTYEIDVTATDSGAPPLSGTGGNFLVTIENVPEPSTLALFGLAMVGGLGLIRRRNG